MCWYHLASMAVDCKIYHPPRPWWALNNEVIKKTSKKTASAWRYVQESTLHYTKVSQTVLSKHNMWSNFTRVCRFICVLSITVMSSISHHVSEEKNRMIIYGKLEHHQHAAIRFIHLLLSKTRPRGISFEWQPVMQTNKPFKGAIVAMFSDALGEKVLEGVSVCFVHKVAK